MTHCHALVILFKNTWICGLQTDIYLHFLPATNVRTDMFHGVVVPRKIGGHILGWFGGPVKLCFEWWVWSIMGLTEKQLRVCVLVCVCVWVGVCVCVCVEGGALHYFFWRNNLRQKNKYIKLTTLFCEKLYSYLFCYLYK